MSAEPWSKFFWSDYDADEGLRMCSLAAQGLWMRMLCLMARATPKGELRVGGEPCTVTDLSRAVGESEEVVTGLLGELDRRGVFSTTRTGVIYSRRLRKDAELSKKRAKAGAKGGQATKLKTHGYQDLPQQKHSKADSKRAAPEARSQSSVTKVTGGEPPGEDPVKLLFDLGVSLLTKAGSTEQAARSMVGKWRRDRGDTELGAALLEAKGKTAPLEWLQRRFAAGDQQDDALYASIDRKYRRAGATQ